MSRWVPLSRCLPNQLQRVVWRWRQPHWSGRIQAAEEHYVFAGWMDGHAIHIVTPGCFEVMVYVDDNDPRPDLPRVGDLEWMELEEQCHICAGAGGVSVGADREIACPACSG
jgi:hypothetical protein